MVSRLEVGATRRVGLGGLRQAVAALGLGLRGVAGGVGLVFEKVELLLGRLVVRS